MGEKSMEVCSKSMKKLLVVSQIALAILCMMSAVAFHKFPKEPCLNTNCLNLLGHKVCFEHYALIFKQKNTQGLKRKKCNCMKV